MNLVHLVGHCTLNFQIAGGTGRFQGASGVLTYTETALPVLADATGNPVFFTETGEFTGTIWEWLWRRSHKTCGDKKLLFDRPSATLHWPDVLRCRADSGNEVHVNATDPRGLTGVSRKQFTLGDSKP